jgi:uncharacterized protein YegL
MRKRIFVLLAMFAVAITLFGCSVTNTTNVTNTGTPPAGTTAVKLSGGNVVVSGNTISFTLTALNQNNDIISGIGTGNLQGQVFTTSLPVSGEVPVATLTFTAVSGGGTGTAKNVAAALVLDKSGSMYYAKVASLETAAKLFVSTEAAASLNNKAAIVNFDYSADLTAPMTLVSDYATLEAAINKDLSQGSTALYDAIVMGVNEASKEAASATLARAVVAMTDGGENYSSTYHTTTEVINAAVAANIPVFTVGLYSYTSEADSYREALKAIAKGTTGSEDNYFEIITGITGLSVKHVSAEQIKALGALTDLYKKLAGALTQSYSTTATLSVGLTSANTYYLQIVMQSYGDFTGETIRIPFTTQ